MLKSTASTTRILLRVLRRRSVRRRQWWLRDAAGASRAPQGGGSNAAGFRAADQQLQFHETRHASMEALMGDYIASQVVEAQRTLQAIINDRAMFQAPC